MYIVPRTKSLTDMERHKEGTYFNGKREAPKGGLIGRGGRGWSLFCYGCVLNCSYLDGSKAEKLIGLCVLLKTQLHVDQPQLIVF